MTKAVLILATDEIRAKAAHWCRALPRLTRVEFREPKRTIPQNARFWAMLTDVATSQRAKAKAGENARDLPPETWKILFLHAIGREIAYEGSLDGSELIAIGLSSSELSIPEMTDLMEFISAWGAENGVIFTDSDKAPF